MIETQTAFGSSLISPASKIGIDFVTAPVSLQTPAPADQVDVRGVVADTAEGRERRPRFATFVRDSTAVNQMLEDIQGVDRYRLEQGEILRQAPLITDAYKRSVFISLIDPGRAMTVLGTREDFKLIES